MCKRRLREGQGSVRIAAKACREAVLRGAAPAKHRRRYRRFSFRQIDKGKPERDLFLTLSLFRNLAILRVHLAPCSGMDHARLQGHLYL